MGTVNSPKSIRSSQSDKTPAPPSPTPSRASSSASSHVPSHTPYRSPVRDPAEQAVIQHLERTTRSLLLQTVEAKISRDRRSEEGLAPQFNKSLADLLSHDALVESLQILKWLPQGFDYMQPETLNALMQSMSRVIVGAKDLSVTLSMELEYFLENLPKDYLSKFSTDTLESLQSFFNQFGGDSHSWHIAFKSDYTRIVAKIEELGLRSSISAALEQRAEMLRLFPPLGPSEPPPPPRAQRAPYQLIAPPSRTLSPSPPRSGTPPRSPPPRSPSPVAVQPNTPPTHRATVHRLPILPQSPPVDGTQPGVSQRLPKGSHKTDFTR